MDISIFLDGATYTQIKDYVLEHSGLKASSLYISRIKRKCGIEVGKTTISRNLRMQYRHSARWKKEKAIREAFKYI